MEDMSSMEKKYTSDEVAQILCEELGDECACNFNGNDEWLPFVCSGIDDCPEPKEKLFCWKEFLKHYKNKEQ